MEKPADNVVENVEQVAEPIEVDDSQKSENVAANTNIEKSPELEKVNDSQEDESIINTDDIIIDRNPVPLAFCEIPQVHSKPENDETDGKSSAIFEDIADNFQFVQNNTQVRKAASVKSFGCDTESEFEFSDEDSEFGDDLKTIRNGEIDSDEEFDRIVKYTNKIIEKIHKSEYPENVPPSSKKTKKPGKSLKTKNVHEYDDMPPLENLKIECTSNLIEFGFVSKVVDCMVLVESTSSEVLDFDSYLFDENSKAIGQVYDIFGQVKTPNYVIRFNSNEEASLIPIKMKVYYAPNNDEYSKTPFKGLNLAAANRDTINKVNKQLDQRDAMERSMQIKERIEGVDSDVEFSDDEAEKEYRKQLKYCSLNDNKGGNRKRDRRGNVDNRKVRFEQNPNPGNAHFGSQTNGQNRRGRGGRGGFAGGQKPGQWDWHNPNSNPGPRVYRRDFDGPATPAAEPVVNAAQQSGAESAPAPTPNPNNPYAEFGCYSGFSGRFGI